MVTDLRPVGAPPMFDGFATPYEAKQIGPLLEQIKHEHSPAWQMRHNVMSPHYTTYWDVLVHCPNSVNFANALLWC